MNLNIGLRIAAVLCFLLGLFGAAPGGYNMMYLGLAAWCSSTIRP